MRTVQTTALVGIVLLLCRAALAESETPTTNDHGLSSADQKLLDGFLKQFLVDPRGAQYVRVKALCRTVWATEGEISREGWLARGQKGKPQRIHFTDGESIAAPIAKRKWK